jgi:hypothetical protein
MERSQSNKLAGKSKKTNSPRPPDLLSGARVYLSGPMDFVVSREQEKKFGWRTRVGQFLQAFGVTVFDPWNKPETQGLIGYGREGVNTDQIREGWTFARGAEGAEKRAKITGHFWQTLHIDLRMVDTADFIVAYCPTGTYSVGTPHEIAMARTQRKPVLLVSPPIQFPALQCLKKHLNNDKRGSDLFNEFLAQSGIKENPRGLPSLWYMPLVGGESFFDGFGFARYMKHFNWEKGPLDEREETREIQNPLLPFLEEVNKNLPKKWDNRLKRFVRNDDWLLWRLKQARPALVESAALPDEVD